MIELWTIYEKPRDYELSYVLRRALVLGGRIRHDAFPTAVAPTLEEVRAKLPAGLTQVQKPGDDPDACIVEVWE